MTISNENDLVRIREMLASPDLASIARDIIEPMLEALLLAWAENEKAKNARVPTEIFCPLCNTKHIDQGEWAHEIAHRKHLCANCKHIWAPYDVGTVGVAYGHDALPVAEHIAQLERDLAWTRSEWGTAGEQVQALETHQEYMAVQYQHQVEALEKRRDELLAMVAKLSQTVPLESEVAEALNQRGALLAEVGTLRARVGELEKQLAGTRGHVNMATEYDGSDYG